MGKRLTPDAFVIIDEKTDFAMTATEPNVSNEELVTQQNIFLLS